MVKRKVLAGVTLALATSAAACASRQPSPELVEARAAYARAIAGTAAQLNPAGLYDARRALEEAERAQEDAPGSNEARSLAYIAERKVLLAESNARLAAAEAELARARADLEQLTSSELSSARNELQKEQQMLESERNARLQAEQRAKEAFDRLSSIAQVKEGPRGTVITLSGSVLFETNRAQLMASAIARLTEVANALQSVEGRRITIMGFTDNVGADQYNLDLSQRRAESVRDFLVSHGVSRELVTSEGRGKADPVASNASSEGRANNRRVEIVVEGEPSTVAAPAPAP